MPGLLGLDLSVGACLLAAVIAGQHLEVAPHAALDANEPVDGGLDFVVIGWPVSRRRTSRGLGGMRIRSGVCRRITSGRL